MNIKFKIINLEYFSQGVEFITDEDYKKSFKLKEGDNINCETWKERNIQFLRKYFALINCTLYHLPESIDEEFKNIDNLRKYITIASGRYKLIPSLKGDPIPEAQSISFKNMDEEEFQNLYNDTLNVIMKYFLKHIKLVDFEMDIMNFY